MNGCNGSKESGQIYEIAKRNFLKAGSANGSAFIFAIYCGGLLLVKVRAYWPVTLSKRSHQ